MQNFAKAGNITQGLRFDYYKKQLVYFFTVLQGKALLEL